MVGLTLVTGVCDTIRCSCCANLIISHGLACQQGVAILAHVGQQGLGLGQLGGELVDALLQFEETKLDCVLQCARLGEASDTFIFYQQKICKINTLNKI